MKNIPEIFLRQGLNKLSFDAPIEEAITFFGEADEVENLSIDDEETTTVLHYYNNGITLFFEEVNPILSCVELNSPETILFGKKVFEMEEKDIVTLMKGQKYFEQNIELEAWGERRVSFDDAVIDFFFEDGKLISVVFGK